MRAVTIRSSPAYGSAPLGPVEGVGVVTLVRSLIIKAVSHHFRAGLLYSGAVLITFAAT
jgi:hypothetical protein